MSERKGTIEREGKRFRLEELNDQIFEAFISELLDNSNVLKKIFDYTNAKFKEGGSDKGRDCILYKENEIVGIVQCKHSIKTIAMSKTIIINEVLKMLLYLYIEPKLLPSKTKKYLFFISSKLTEESYNHLKNFKEKELKDRKNIKNKINLLRKKYKEIEKKIEEKSIEEQFFLKLEKIFDSLDIEYLTDLEIQTYMENDDPIIGAILSKYFRIKSVVIKEVKDFPRIKEYEAMDCEVYKKERFHEKLEEIKVSNSILENALESYGKKVVYSLKLLEENHYYIKEDLKEYENIVKNKEILLRENKKIDLEDEELENKKLIKEYRKHYLEIISKVEECKFRNFDYIPPEFARGTIQELVNNKEIENWILAEENEEW